MFEGPLCGGSKTNPSTREPVEIGCFVEVFFAGGLFFICANRGEFAMLAVKNLFHIYIIQYCAPGYDTV